MKPLRFLLISFLLVTGNFIAGCGKSDGIPAGCPVDLTVPTTAKILGSSYDESLFVLRMRSISQTTLNLVNTFKETMIEDGWTQRMDSTTTSGGEIIFDKPGENGGPVRRCTIFIAPAVNSEGINVDIRCDR